MRSRAALRLVLILLVFATACTGGDGPAAETRSGSPSASLDVPVGAFFYEGPGIEATFDLRGEQGRLVVLNETGFPLGRPGIYLLDARDGRRIEGEVVSPSRIPNRATRAFDVTVDGAPEHKHIGIVALLFGGDDYGAFDEARSP
jgi:hypothetical protein